MAPAGWRWRVAGELPGLETSDRDCSELEELPGAKAFELLGSCLAAACHGLRLYSHFPANWFHSSGTGRLVAPHLSWEGLGA